jgi:hypothetical protein
MAARGTGDWQRETSHQARYPEATLRVSGVRKLTQTGAVGLFPAWNQYVDPSLVNQFETRANGSTSGSGQRFCVAKPERALKQFVDVDGSLLP